MATLRCAHNNDLTDIQGDADCSLCSLYCTALNCYHNMATPWKNFQEEMKKERVGCCNNPGNKAAQAVRKNCQNILDAGELVIQCSSEEVTGKLQKYARMGARQFLPNSYGELTIENIKEACTRHFTHRFQLGKNVACDVLSI